MSIGQNGSNYDIEKSFFVGLWRFHPPFYSCSLSQCKLMETKRVFGPQCITWHCITVRLLQKLASRPGALPRGLRSRYGVIWLSEDKTSRRDVTEWVTEHNVNKTVNHSLVCEYFCPLSWRQILNLNGGCLTVKTTTPMIPRCLRLLFCSDWEAPSGSTLSVWRGSIELTFLQKCACDHVIHLAICEPIITSREKRHLPRLARLPLQACGWVIEVV